MIKFLMGHEVGHIRRKHLTKKILLTPGMILPLIGEAYHRACEATCDRFGAYRSNDPVCLHAGADRACIRAGSGERQYAILCRPAFHYARFFSVPWHELMINYPTLSQRVAQILGFSAPQYARRSGRHWLAYPCALLFSAKNILYIYLAVVAISVLIALGNQVKEKEAALQAAAGAALRTIMLRPVRRLSPPTKRHPLQPPRLISRRQTEVSSKRSMQNSPFV